MACKAIDGGSIPPGVSTHDKAAYDANEGYQWVMSDESEPEDLFVGLVLPSLPDNDAGS